ncbi:hypothetical protein EJ05DRAFT_60654 [Pseudovirgaria hyperparasitica]|uniref:BCS1 N-terminal domain-containing protein n=1 Tax=Pseudovirgaria hyperparasitica TaxID=470096 RepID=A0A6A6W5E0_9PEZI|nr:uncharacterized protein EJ05DRAFT_60654 [Pseudovirgaria hyperparasitica]KAF2757254.1 hypothetical protein EJ05DRAFT_60654 [Pseudovirgaria hyperparasitica]
MATYNDAFSVPLHPSSPQSISLIDLLFPSLNTTLVAFQQLLAGHLNSCAGLLGLCRLVAFAARYFYRHSKGAVRECYSQLIPHSIVTTSHTRSLDAVHLRSW